jgi:phytoene dehydrogenase-like protein
MRSSYDAVVVGSGPNGLAAAITIARTGRSVVVIEAQGNIGGGASSEQLTLPGFKHDVCSAVHPMALASPFFAGLKLEEHGLEWIHPPASLAHALDEGAVVMNRSIDLTAGDLGEDGTRYRKLVKALVNDWKKLAAMFLGPPRIPRHPVVASRFGMHAIRSARGFVRTEFRGERARALFAGLAAHSVLPLEKPPSAAFGLILMATAHVLGWPFARGGSQSVANALASCLGSLGGEIVVNSPVESLDDLPSARAILCDLTPRQLLRIAGCRLPERSRRRFARFRYGPGVYKVDWALSAPVPWKSPSCAQAGTVHLGGSFDEIAASERDAWQGKHTEKPFVLLAQPSLFDETRAPEGQHTAWAYCHVPQASQVEMVGRIEDQIERFAPGFRSRVLAKNVLPPLELERHNANLIGGSINGGAQDLRQLFFRPTRRLYSTSCKGLYLCSSSTPPGPGVHGLCGYYAAQAALRDVLR